MPRPDEKIRNDGTMKAPYIPEEIDDATLVFPASVSHLMPTWADIPAEFKDMHGTNPWTKIAMAWFFSGLNPKVEFHANPGYDPQKAYRHLAAIMGSWEPKQEHKLASVAYLMSIWFKKIKRWEKK